MTRFLLHVVGVVLTVAGFVRLVGESLALTGFDPATSGSYYGWASDAARVMAACIGFLFLTTMTWLALALAMRPRLDQAKDMAPGTPAYVVALSVYAALAWLAGIALDYGARDLSQWNSGSDDAIPGIVIAAVAIVALGGILQARAVQEILLVANTPRVHPLSSLDRTKASVFAGVVLTVGLLGAAGAGVFWGTGSAAPGPMAAISCAGAALALGGFRSLVMRWREARAEEEA